MLYTVAMKLTSLLSNGPKQGYEDKIGEMNKVLYQAGVQSLICNVVTLAIISPRLQVYWPPGLVSLKRLINLTNCQDVVSSMCLIVPSIQRR